MKLCLLIPNYNHGATMQSLLTKLAEYNLPCIIVDDGSDNATKQLLQQAVVMFPWASLLTLENNQGKGAALIAGFHQAQQLGFTHALQIDADEQHSVSDVAKFITASNDNPQALISGLPVFDSTIPKSRLYGKKLTTFWVAIETLSFDVKDAMCGFRLYPLAATLNVLASADLGHRMDFDIEIIVRLCWSGCPLIYIPTKVIYPENGVSHFDVVRDNMRVTWAHTRLVFGMLKRLPQLLWRKYIRLKQHWFNLPWYQIKERGSLLGIKFVIGFYRFFGRRPVSWLLYPIMTYYYFTSVVAKQASKQYLAHLEPLLPASQFEQLSSFKHFLSFADTILDKLAVWSGKLNLAKAKYHNLKLTQENFSEKRGAVILTAHIGNLEFARALSGLRPDIVVNALVFTKNSKKIGQELEKLNPKYRVNLIEVTDVNMPLAITLRQKIDAGEILVIVADRVSVTNTSRIVEAKFLGEIASFPQGPFILAGLMHCKIYFMVCLKQSNDDFEIFFEEFSEGINLSQQHREQQLRFHAQKYADSLTRFCLKAPLQWFNFFNFWKNYNNMASKAYDSKRS